MNHITCLDLCSGHGQISEHLQFLLLFMQKFSDIPILYYSLTSALLNVTVMASSEEYWEWKCNEGGNTLRFLTEL